MKTPLRSCIYGLLASPLLAVAPLSASTLLFQENFNGSGFSPGSPIPTATGANPGWVVFGNSPASAASVIAMPNDQHGRAPLVGNAGSFSRVAPSTFTPIYQTNQKLDTAVSSYVWSFQYKHGGSDNYAYLDTGSSQAFAGLRFQGTALHYYSGSGGSLGTYSLASGVSVAADTWYDIEYTFDIITVGGVQQVNSSFSITALGASTPLYERELFEVSTTSTLTGNIRMAFAPQGTTSFMLAETSLTAIPEPGSIALLAIGGIAFTLLRRRQIA